MIARYLNLAILVLVNLLWAAQYPAYKIAAEHMSPAALNFWSLFVATAIMLPFQKFSYLWEPELRPALDRRAVVDFLLLGVLGIVPPSLFLAWGIAHSTAGNAAIIQLTIPVLMAVLAVILLGERFTNLRVASLMVALLGTLLTSWRVFEGAGIDSTLLAGNAVIFLSGLGSAFFNTYGKRMLTRFGGLRVLIYSYVVAFLTCALVSLLTDEVPFYATRGLPLTLWLSIATLGALTWSIGMILWMWVLGRLEAIQVSTSIYLLPVFGVVLSAIVIGEQITLFQVAGGLLALLGTLLTSAFEERRRFEELRSGP